VNDRVTLPLLDERIEARARATRELHAFWPCAEGCDLCCRSLPRLPTISSAEWERLYAAVEQLPAGIREAIVEHIHAAPETGPLTCPMLDRDRGACLVYEARPIACRTYGFYTERDAGLHCEQVMRAVEEHAGEMPVVWGNGEAIAADMKAFGEVTSLREWLLRSVRAP
jgi:uncharacterized protein